MSHQQCAFSSRTRLYYASNLSKLLLVRVDRPSITTDRCMHIGKKTCYNKFTYLVQRRCSSPLRAHRQISTQQRLGHDLRCCIRPTLAIRLLTKLAHSRRANSLGRSSSPSGESRAMGSQTFHLTMVFARCFGNWCPEDRRGSFMMASQLHLGLHIAGEGSSTCCVYLAATASLRQLGLRELLYAAECVCLPVKLPCMF
ncbi:hypothetical protein P171DRAFT_188968 [Karstenula rhodostoma CBS 690.94]|uniref:Uncharacterized protein n=1 Tax=Karstenula rhodostoma CBS 690.94 TaxID=1392251 RepID=A0A9P4UHH5_9PLEO|nr:hypothetical protein P171DRAFT_188968 [Karstenula rhodostoma CBS 690.94]